MFFLEDIKNNRSDDGVACWICAWRSRSASLEKYKVVLMADLFNALNSNAVTNFNLTNGANFNSINATLDPRTFMIGLRFDF